MIFRSLGVLSLCAMAVAGCAKASHEIGTTDVSPLQYSTFNCRQLAAEAHRISRKAAVLTHKVDEKANDDGGAAAVGIILFWPALFFIDGDGPETYELARIKGEMDAIEVAAIQKDCPVKVVRPKSTKPPDVKEEKDKG